MTLRQYLIRALTQPHWLEKYNNHPTGRVLASPDDLITDILHAVDEWLTQEGLSATAYKVKGEPKY